MVLFANLQQIAVCIANVPIEGKHRHRASGLKQTIYLKRFYHLLKLPDHKLSFVSCWISRCKCQTRSNLTRTNGGSKIQVLLQDFPSLGQKCWETCPLYFASGIFLVGRKDVTATKQFWIIVNSRNKAFSCHLLRVK